MSDQSTVFIGVLLIAVGFLVALFAFIFLATGSGRLHGQGGAVVIIGPFPIVLGSDRAATKGLLLLAIFLVSLLIVLFLLGRR